jgi:hypothetical protein
LSIGLGDGRAVVPRGDAEQIERRCAKVEHRFGPGRSRSPFSALNRVSHTILSRLFPPKRLRGQQMDRWPTPPVLDRLAHLAI